MGAGDERQPETEARSPNGQHGGVGSATPRLADGTRADVDAQRTGICIETRCRSVEQFVATFQRYCEDSAIFMPNVRRDVGTVLPFSFDLATEENVLVGIGTVLEAFETVDNRFGRAGIVVSVKKLKRESVAVFKQLLVARKEALLDQHTPPPVLTRATTAPIAIDDPRKARPTRPIEVQIPNLGERTAADPQAKPTRQRPTLALGVQIPNPSERASTKPRAKTMLGLPAIAPAPTKRLIMQIPAIPRRVEPDRSPAVVAPDATPTRVDDAVGDAIPDALPETGHDTVRDEFPFALRNELRSLEQRAAVAPVIQAADIDEGWDVEQAPTPAAELGAQPAPELILRATPAHEAIPLALHGDEASAAREAVPEPLHGDEVSAAHEAVREPVQEHEAAVALEAPAPMHGVEAAAPDSAEPVALEAPPEPGVVAPRFGIWTDDAWGPGVDAIPMPVTAVASDAATIPTAAAMCDDVASVPAPARRPLRWAARIAIALTLFVASAATVVMMDSPTFSAETPSTTNSTSEPAAPTPSAPTQSVDEPRVIAEPQSATSEQRALTIAEQGCASASSSTGCEQQRKAFREAPKSPAQRPAQRPRSRKLVQQKRARPASSKKSCSGLDCL